MSSGVNAASDLESGAGDVDYFLSIPWCRALLRPGENLPVGSNVPVVHISLPRSRRQPRHTSSPNGSGSTTTTTTTTKPPITGIAFTTTLNTADTIGAFIVFYEEPALPPGAHPAYRPPVVEIKALLRLGNGMAGHVGYVHGGFVATIFDEVLSLGIPVNQGRTRHNQRLGIAPPAPEPTSLSSSSSSSSASSPAHIAAAQSGHIATKYMTGYLNTTYLRPVKTMATVLVTSRFTRLEGTRKFFFEGDIRDQDNKLLVKAECVYITLKGKL